MCMGMCMRVCVNVSRPARLEDALAPLESSRPARPEDALATPAPRAVSTERATRLLRPYSKELPSDEEV